LWVIERFWGAYFAVVEDSPFRGQAEELMTRFGLDATFEDMRLIAAEHQQRHDEQLQA